MRQAELQDCSVKKTKGKIYIYIVHLFLKGERNSKTIFTFKHFYLHRIFSERYTRNFMLSVSGGWVTGAPRVTSQYLFVVFNLESCECVAYLKNEF